ncbi:MAG: hypothetical protein FJZ58_03730 [Chlamydiae bacterium]|nr:hypothetical protein [Chlamydiota bacterium]
MGVHEQVELDLLIKDGKRLGFAIKYSAAPSVTKSMQVAIDILKLDDLIVVYPGTVNYPLTKSICVQSLQSK